jgi:beta-D-galactosyl-(1->4)-L-rhamnose phosphorylase
MRFWVNIRRGLLRVPIDRIGLGGYLHLVQDFPDFVDAIDHIADEFRLLKQFHAGSAPYTAPLKVVVLTAWGKWRSWDYVGHFIPGIEIYEVTESLAGLPVDVSFINFHDILEYGVPDDVDVIINAGKVGTAWSGGEHWTNTKVVEAITKWVSDGGGFIGIGEPSAIKYSSQYFQLAHLLGVDREIGLRMSNVKLPVSASPKHFILEDLDGSLDFGKDIDNIYILSKDTIVLVEKEGSPQITLHSYGKGETIYMSGFKFSPENSRLLHRSICTAAGKESEYRTWTCSNVHTDCAYYPADKKLVVISGSDHAETTKVFDDAGKTIEVDLKPHGIQIIDV